MTDLDREIADALDAEDRDLLDRYGEQGLFGQLGGLFQGKLGWLSAIMMVAGTGMFAVGVYAAWKIATIDDVPTMLRWAGIGWFGLFGMGLIKIWSWTRMESNRVLREVKRVELQVARLQAKVGE